MQQFSSQLKVLSAETLRHHDFQRHGLPYGADSGGVCLVFTDGSRREPGTPRRAAWAVDGQSCES